MVGFFFPISVNDAHATPVALLSRFASSDYLVYSMTSWLESFGRLFPWFFCRARLVVLPRCHGVCCAAGFPALPRFEGLISGLFSDGSVNLLYFLQPPCFSLAAQVCIYRLQVVGACLVVGVVETGPVVGKTAVRKVLASIASSGAMPRGEDSNGPVKKSWSHGHNQNWSTGHSQSWRAPPMIGDGKGRPGWIATAAAGAVESVLTSTVKENVRRCCQRLDFVYRM